MNRMLLPALALLSAATPLVVDSALKGAVLLSAALLSSLLLWRASAATRHLVWLVGVLALLAVPLLSLVLPSWRVLPTWAVPPAVAASAVPRKEMSSMPHKRHGSFSAGPAIAQAPPSLAAHPEPSPATPTPASIPAAVPSPAAAPVALTPPAPWWRTALPSLWSAGCAALLLRLLGAHWLLRRAARRAQPVTDGPLAAALAAAASQLGVTQHVRLLVEEKRTIPVVWGVWRPRLMLPTEAVTWDEEQLQSVLLHELAHIRRSDTLVQWLTQLACTLHWFNPLVWLAAWRLHVERERACDDMVLASGVKPSAYAGHLLSIASQLSPARWTSACGLAMARKSALEGRLHAVLSEKLNRRRLTGTLTATAILLSAAIAVPIAMLRAADEEWNPPSGAHVGGNDFSVKPNHKDAVALYEIWQRHARLSGDIPGALIGELAAAVKVFIGYNPTWETVPKLKEILPRLDATHDWKPGDAIALLNEVAAVQDSPLQTAAEKLTAATISQGNALPENFANVAWGETQPNGLRAAWVLEPVAAEHRMGTALKARLLVQNTGKLPVMARVPTWHQGGVSARNAEGSEVQVSGIEWTTIARLVPVRLAPGHFIEINAPGVGLGPDAGRGPWAGPRVGSHVLAKDGTDLTLIHDPLALDGSGVGMREDAPHLIGPGWWQAHIKARLARELPLPASGAKRTHLLDRAMRELFATTPTADEINAFATDPTDGAFDALVQRLAARADVVEFAGSLPTATVKFRVLAADPAAAKTPRVVLGPGEYPLSGGTAEYGAVTLKIVGRPVGDRRTNDAGLLFEATEATGKLRPDPHKLEIPDGWGTWAIVCRPGEGTFYLLHKGGARKIDYTHPHQITDTPTTDLPAEFRDEVKRQLDIAGVPAESQAEVFDRSEPPATTPEPKTGATSPVMKTGAKLSDSAYPKSGVPLAEQTLPMPPWGEEKDGLSAGIRVTGEARIGGEVKAELWVRNSSAKDVKFSHCHRADVGMYVVVKDKAGKDHAADITSFRSYPVFGRLLLPPGHIVKLKEFSVKFRAGKNDTLESGWVNLDLTPGDYKLRAVWSDTTSRGAAEGEWTGKLTTGEVDFKLAAVNTGADAGKPNIATPDAPAPKSAEAGPRADDAALQPKHESAQSLFRKWQANARTDGKIPGALIGQLARTTDDAVKQTNDAHVSAKLAALRPRLDASRDWTQADVVALLDDLTAIATAPVSWTDTAMEFSSMRVVRQGKALPVELGSAAWGAPAENGLRTAWRLEPGPLILEIESEVPATANAYRLGSVLKARVLFHNTGKEPVVFETETWHQDDHHSARDAKGAEIPVKATWFTGITPTSKFRLAPGEYCEVRGHGVAIGAGEYTDEHSTGAVGAIIEAKEGETVTLSHSVDAGTGGWTQPDDLWLTTIAGRVANEAPMPASAADREQLIRRVTLDIFGVAPTAEEIAAFTVDNTPDALAKLTARLQTQPRIEPFVGKLPTGETKFRVIASDPNATQAPRPATAPGRYVLGDGVHLQVRQVTEGDKRTNSAEILFFGPGPKVESPHKPYPIGFYVPDSAYAFVWERGANTLWVTEISEGEPIRPWLLGSPERPGPQKVTVRAFDFSNPADVKLTHVSCSENGGEWSWGKIVPTAFQQPVLNALGERGKRLRDFLPPGESRKLDRTKLEGTWEGEKDGVTVKVAFQWLSEHQQVRWEVNRPSSSIAADMSVVIAPDGNSAEFIFRKGVEFEATQGRLSPGEAGTLNLEIIPNPKVSDPGYPAVKGLVLKPKSAA